MNELKLVNMLRVGANVMLLVWAANSKCELAHHLFGDLVRVQGHGRWRRNSDRVWVLESFKIKYWEPIDQTSLEDTVKALRAVEGSQWNTFADPQAELKKLREA